MAGGAVAGLIAYHIAHYGKDYYQKRTDFLLKMKHYEDEILERRARKLELITFLKNNSPNEAEKLVNKLHL
jgi:hypothetical protein